MAGTIAFKTIYGKKIGSFLQAAKILFDLKFTDCNGGIIYLHIKII